MKESIGNPLHLITILSSNPFLFKLNLKKRLIPFYDILKVTHILATSLILNSTHVAQLPCPLTFLCSPLFYPTKTEATYCSIQAFNLVLV